MCAALALLYGSLTLATDMSQKKRRLWTGFFAVGALLVVQSLPQVLGVEMPVDPDAPHVIDIRNLGLIGGIELEPRANASTQRALEAFKLCFDKGVLIRVTGDIVAFSPPLIIEKREIDQIVDTVKGALRCIQ